MRAIPWKCIRRTTLSIAAAVLLPRTVSAAQTNVYYVDAGNGVGASAPYTNWATAAAAIQSAVDQAEVDFGPGTDCVVIVTNGLYDTGGRASPGTLSNRVVISLAITLCAISTNPADTVIAGAWAPNGYTGYPDPPPNSNGAVRCVYLADGATLIGFTLTNGATLNETTDDGRAGGVFCEGAGSIVSNCVIVEASAKASAASGYRGTYYGCLMYRTRGGVRHVSNATLYDCEIIGRYPESYYDGGVSYSVLHRCRIENCWQKYGGGAASCTLYECMVTGNRGNTARGGLSDCTAYDCVITSNSTSRTGGGAWMGTLIRCVVTGNEAGWEGGGVADATVHNSVIMGNTALREGGGGAVRSDLYNCLIISNQATRTPLPYGLGGGVRECDLYNCTVVSNTAGTEGGGVYAGTVVNSVIWSNVAASVGDNYYGGPVFSNSCTTPAQSEWDESNISGDPLFVDLDGGDFHLAAGSPCINKAMEFSWMTDGGDPRRLDLGGNERIQWGGADMGAYESPPPVGTFLMVR